MINLLKNLDRKLVFILIFLGLIFSLTGLFLFKKIEIFYTSFFLLISALFYLVIRSKGNIYPVAPISNANRILILTNILFFSSLSLGFFFLNKYEYSRPLSFLIIIVIMSTLTAIEIFLTKNRRYIFFILFKAMLIGVLLRGSLIFQYPSLTTDAVYHAEFISRVVQNGHVPQFGLYKWYPFSQLMAAQLVQLTDISIKAALFIISSAEAVSMVFIFLIVRRFFDEKIAILSFLILEIAPTNIYYSTIYLGGGTFALILFVMIVYLIFSSNKDKKIHTSILLLLLAEIILAHTFLPTVLIITMLSIYVTSLLLIKILSSNKKSTYDHRYVTLNLIIFFIVSLLSYWTYVSHFFQGFIVPTLFMFDLQSLGSSAHAIGEQAIPALWNLLPLLLLISFSLIGVLFCIKEISKSKIPISILYLGTLSVVLASFIAVSHLLGFTSLVYTRWLVFLEIFLAAFCVIGIILVTGVRTRRTLPLFFCIFFVLSFIFITNPFINIQKVVPWSDQRPRPVLITSEITACDFTDFIPANDVYMDNICYRRVTYNIPSVTGEPRLAGGHYFVIDPIVSGEQKDFEGFLLLRNEIKDVGILVRYPKLQEQQERTNIEMKVDQSRYEYFTQGDGYITIYDNGLSKIISNSSTY